MQCVPIRQKNVLSKRARGLVAVVKSRKGPSRVVRSAEKVRSAALAFIRVKRALIAEDPKRDSFGAHQLHNLEIEERQWLAMSIQSIVEKCAREVV